MRKDSLGLFWEDLDPKEEKKKAYLLENGWAEHGGRWYRTRAYHEGIELKDILFKLEDAYILERGTTEKCEPPERTWEAEDYLPGLEEAQRFDVELFTDEGLVNAWIAREPLVFDIECYINYYLIAFASIVSKRVVYFELRNGVELDIPKLRWVLENFKVVTFNGNNYDIPIATLSLAGKNNAALKKATEQIIELGARPSDVLRANKVKRLNIDHIDIMEVAPLTGSLKIYGGRLHTKRMQDLPFPPERFLSNEQIDIVRYYCVNDLRNTYELYSKLIGEIELRERLGREYALDLRSKSDAQIAEAVISNEIEKLTGRRCQKPKIEAGTAYKYNVPEWMHFESDLMKWVLNIVRSVQFVVNEKGSINIPAELSDLVFDLGHSSYKLQIGGLHSREKCMSHVSDENYQLIDRDVASYYPRIILNQGLYPKHLGPIFLEVYDKIVERRLAAKKRSKSSNKNEAKNGKLVANSLKIVINGSYGKLSSKWSVLYAPNLLVQVTLTGQLSLLMLIEMLELRGIPVVSANTDGIVIKCPNDKKELLDQCVAHWEHVTQYETEETRYKGYYARAVNDYIAIKEDNTLKTKGCYARAGLQKNPVNEVCIDAIENLFIENKPVEETIKNCNNISKFLAVRTVKGGAVKDGEYLGKAIRWYYAKGEEGTIIYANSGKKVPKSNGAKPLMEIPDKFPEDVDYDWYIQEVYKNLEEMGYRT